VFRTWLGLGFDVLQLHAEAQRVIGLRMIKLAQGGPAAQAEAHRMVAEKTAAMAEAAFTLASGGSAKTVMRRYRTHVRANTRRLTRRSKP
jgi:hypothetical protein